MLRDNLVGLIEPMRSSAGANPLALCTAKNESSDDRPPCLENPRPEGAESTLTENGASPFHAEPRHHKVRLLIKICDPRRDPVKRVFSLMGEKQEPLSRRIHQDGIRMGACELADCLGRFRND